MDREKALELLRGGEDGVKEWNRRLREGEEIPDLRGADLRGANLRGADLRNADLNGANLYRAILRDANLEGADLRGANLHGVDLLGAILHNGDLTRTILREACLHRADLSGANLHLAALGGADLSRAIFNGADLHGARLRNANLSYADLHGADLSYADLCGATIFSANLYGVDLHDADLTRANLTDTNLRRANLRGAEIVYTVFANVDLTEARSLELVKHEGPSSLGFDTLLKSGGKIPASFLEGCGVPDTWITYLPSLLGKPIDYFSCFISYSHEDEEFSKRLHSRMREDHLRVWYAPEDMKAGRKIHEQIDTAIRLHDKLLVVLSEHSMQSEWVKTEIRHARQREVKEGRRVLFPIRLVPIETIRDWKAFDADTGKDMAVEIREYFIPDFTNWKDHDAFQESYQRLMKDFKPAPDDS